MTENYRKHEIYLAFGAGRERTFGHVFSMNQGPPAPPHPIAHTMKMHEIYGFSMILGPPGPPTPPPKPCKCMETFVFSMDQGPPAPPHPIAHTMKMYGNLWIFNESGAARAPPLHCQHNESSWKSLIFNDSCAARAAHPTAETM